MHLHIGATDFWLDGLIIETILGYFCASQLATLCAVCKSLRPPAQLASHRALIGLVSCLQSSLLQHYARGTWIHQLRNWEAMHAATVMWLQASCKGNGLVHCGDSTQVKKALDLSGHGNAAHSHHRMPILRENAVNGHAAFEFDGASVLKTKPFAQPLPQPVTLMVVGRARGDTTMIDSLSPECVLWTPLCTLGHLLAAAHMSQ